MGSSNSAVQTGFACCSESGEERNSEGIPSPKTIVSHPTTSGACDGTGHREATAPLRNLVEEIVLPTFGIDSEKDAPPGDKLVFEDGSVYRGQTLDGKRAGHGVYTSSTEQYKGQWLNNVQHGGGRQTWSDGRVYEGEWQAGKFSGKGRMEWQKEEGTMVYEGEYLEDLKDGYGVFLWPDGRCYRGEWLRGKRHGRGSFKTANSEFREAIWSEDRLVRYIQKT
eukprot:TRINITY_DN13808_c0_g2_i1.p1 TRINITY_DN13808_c0_g2~~TRINITY_DN13808_c0_g2_i1.p1  ORF type:complete len:223 (+),score=27.76 TRINITY_DN13808_c0_g2_i1:30-698(+)